MYNHAMLAASGVNRQPKFHLHLVSLGLHQAVLQVFIASDSCRQKWQQYSSTEMPHKETSHYRLLSQNGDTATVMAHSSMSYSV